MAPSTVPSARIRALNGASASERGDYVLYWMTSYRRTHYNFALDRALQWAARLHRPLLVLEAFRVDYPWASTRLHRFVLDGMLDNQAACRRAGVTYFPYLEPKPGAARGLLRSLSKRAAVIITDDYPGFFIPRLLKAARDLPACVEAVDSNGLLPLRSADRAFARAVDFRRHLHKHLAPHLWEMPSPEPLADHPRKTAQIHADVLARWPATDLHTVELDRLPVDASVPTVNTLGGARSGSARLEAFLAEDLVRYGAKRNEPTDDAGSRLSPYLHFGFTSVHEVLHKLADRERWTPHELGHETRGSRRGWWNMSADAESFLDELVTWRELGFNGSVYEPRYDSYDCVPTWARESLDEHEGDPRSHVYSFEEFDEARTHDAIWNAAQRQLRAEGRIHNYLRMLWGKKVLEWSATSRDAFAVLVELNNRYALDGRDPNSYSGIAWCFGRYDRAWGPQRPIFGKVRYMSSRSTRRKLRLGRYLDRYAT